MNWASTKQRARDKVHNTFAVDALYTPVSELDNEAYEPVTVQARFQQKTGLMNDDYDGDFNPGLLGQINRVILNTSQVTSPARGDKLVFPDYENTEVQIENWVWQGQYRVVCEVVT